MTLLFSFPEQAALGASLAKTSNLQQGAWEWRHFPDNESYVRILSNVNSQPAIILCSLNNPDTKLLPLVFLARTLKERGASRLTLITPYLGYMRQDKAFHEGEAVTSAIFADLLSRYIDKLVTIDPHLHRYKKLEEIYDCECHALSAMPLVTDWIRTNIKKPLIIGPDAESEQWVNVVAKKVGAPYIVLNKTRHGDRNVDIELPPVQGYGDYTPVLLDDIISTAVTMQKTIKLLRQQEFERIICLATHAVFASEAYDTLLKMGRVEVVTANTIPHSSNKLDVALLLTSDY